MKKLLIISLFVLISSKNTAIEFGKEVEFDKSNKEFEFSGQPDTFFIHAVYSDSLTLKLSWGGSSTSSSSNKGGVGLISTQENPAVYKIELEPGSDAKGKLWVNPSKNELVLDMNKKVEWKFDIDNENKGAEANLTYVINKAEKDAKFVFTFNNEINQIKVPNPFIVCHGTECQDNVSTYELKKGESYKINVKYTKIGNNYVFPSFSFGEEEKKSSAFGLMLNIWIIYLLLIFIL